jgi:hypothetical protein
MIEELVHHHVWLKYHVEDSEYWVRYTWREDQERFATSTPGEILTVTPKYKSPDEAISGIAYEVTMGNLNYFIWRELKFKLAWTETMTELDPQLTAKLSLPSPWNFETLTGDPLISDMIAGETY